MEETSPAAAAGVDRISQLPAEIIHIILKSLHSHKSAARTSILSRTWLHNWTTYPIVQFNDTKASHVNFESFLAATSKRLLLAPPPLLLDTFAVRLGRHGKKRRKLYDENQNPNLYQLLSSGSSRSPVRVSVINDLISSCYEVDLLIHFGLLFLNCGRTKFLELIGCDIREGLQFHSGMDNLRELRLESVKVTAQSFSSFANSSRRLEKLKLREIQGIDHSLDIAAPNFPNLKSLCVERNVFELRLCSPPLLETFSFTNSRNLLNVVSPAPNVKSVNLHLDCGEIEELISEFPSLESLYFRLNEHVRNRKVEISAHKLRKLTVEGSHMELAIDAPNLEILTTKEGWLNTECSAVNVPRSCWFVFRCICNEVTTSWLIELRKCLAAFAARFHHLVFKLEFHTCFFDVKSSFDLTQVGMESSPRMVGHLLMGIDSGSRIIETNVFDIILSAFHPKKLSIPESPCNQPLFSYVSEQIDRENQRNCCSNDMCWRHQYKDVEIRSVTEDCISNIDSMISQSSVDIIFLVKIVLIRCI
ncbi:hypothetical protein LINGRAHAP2_LOCUS18339 [Linum grandiflorum]